MTGRPLGQLLRAHVAAILRSGRWTREQLADQLTQAGYEITAGNLTNRIVRSSDVDLDEAAALARVLAQPGIDALIKSAETGCRRCHGIPPEGFTCTSCGASA